jgi:hypothetical protein
MEERTEGGVHRRLRPPPPFRAYVSGTRGGDSGDRLTSRERHAAVHRGDVLALLLMMLVVCEQEATRILSPRRYQPNNVVVVGGDAAVWFIHPRVQGGERGKKRKEKSEDGRGGMPK